MKLKTFTSIFLFIGLLLMTLGCQQSEPKAIVKVDKIDNNFWKKSKKPKNELHRDGPHNFYDYHHAIRTRDGESAPRYQTNYKQSAFLKAKAANRAASRSREDLDWIERGPGNVGGRTRGLLVDARDNTHLTWLAGSAGGGIWKTEDGANTWRLVSEEIPNMATTTLATSVINPEVIYAGTGEGFDEQMVLGDGIYKSTDGGENWSLLEATANLQFGNVMRIVVDPNDENTLLAATRVNLRQEPDTTASTIISYILKTIVRAIFLGSH